MSYETISVKDAIRKINSDYNGWFLPAIQRPYVWGSRYENENYICKLFDSIFKGYPIGALIIWNTDVVVSYREFIKDYQPDNIPKLVDKGLHARKDKWLIYDGQQRLQTLFSCLKHTFNNKVLIFNLLYDEKDTETEETGFYFVEKNENISWHKIRMNELFVKTDDTEKTKLRKEIISKNQDITEDQEFLIEKNIDKLWSVFVKTDTKSLAYFPIESRDENVVNEVFARLNTGGMALSLSDLLFTEIKKKSYDFEEKLQKCSKKIYNITGNGYMFNAYNILQLLNLIVKNAVKIDPTKTKNSEIEEMKNAWDILEQPLTDFFKDYIYGYLSINNSSIVPKNLALLPVMVYFYEIYKVKYKKLKDVSSQNLQTINRYFIKSQINDWNLPRYAGNFTRIIQEKSAKAKKEGSDMFDFPLKDIEDYVNEKELRDVVVKEKRFIGYIWFALKMLTPNRVYQFDPEINGRFNPEIDHIFPRKLNGMSDEYTKEVDILWNMQPITGEINVMKTNIHPKDFFTDKYVNSKSNNVLGSKYLKDYDFLPDKEFSDDGVWTKPYEFISERRKLMIKFLKDKYGLELITEIQE